MHKSRRKDMRGVSTVIVVLNMLVLAAAQDTQAALPLNANDTTPAPAPASAAAVPDVEESFGELSKEIKVAEVPEYFPGFSGDNITVGIESDVNLTGIPGGEVEITVGVGSESVSIGAVQIEKAEGSHFCGRGSVSGVAQVEACLGGTIDDNGSIIFSANLSIHIPKEDPCSVVNCQFQFSREITCEIVIDGFDTSLDCEF
jgi:hypothetical protein